MVSVGVTGHRVLAEYERDFQYLLDHCDVILAVWDGEDAQGRGGTGQIVRLAREAGMAVAWVHAGNRQPGTMTPISLDPDQGLVTYERFPEPR